MAGNLYRMQRSRLLDYVSDSDDSSDSYVLDSSSDFDNRFRESSIDQSKPVTPELTRSATRGGRAVVVVKKEPVTPMRIQKEFSDVSTSTIDEEIDSIDWEKRCMIAEANLTEEIDNSRKATHTINELTQQVAELSSTERENRETIDNLTGALEKVKSEYETIRNNNVVEEQEFINQIQRLTEEKGHMEDTIELCKSDHLKDVTAFETEMKDLEQENLKIKAENEANRNMVEKMVEEAIHSNAQIAESYKQELISWKENVEQLAKENEVLYKKNEALESDLRDQIDQVFQIKESKMSLSRTHDDAIKLVQEENMELKNCNSGLQKQLELLKTLIHSTIDPLVRCVDPVESPKMDEHIEQGFKSYEATLLKKKENIDAFCEERMAYIGRGVESINHEKARLQNLKEEAVAAVNNFKKGLSDFSSDENTLQSEKVFDKLEECQASFKVKIENNQKKHIENDHNSREEDKKRKKIVGDKMTKFKEFCDNVRSIKEEAKSIAEGTKELREELWANLKCIKEWNMQIGSKLLGNPQTNEDQSDDPHFTGKLHEYYWNDDTNADYMLGINTHRFVAKKGLQINEIVIPNQTVSVLNLSKEPTEHAEDESEPETLSLGYGDNKKASFMNAVENIKNNRHLMKLMTRSSKCPSVVSSVR